MNGQCQCTHGKAVAVEGVAEAVWEAGMGDDGWRRRANKQGRSLQSSTVAKSAGAEQSEDAQSTECHNKVRAWWG